VKVVVLTGAGREEATTGKISDDVDAILSSLDTNIESESDGFVDVAPPVALIVSGRDTSSSGVDISPASAPAAATAASTAAPSVVITPALTLSDMIEDRYLVIVRANLVSVMMLPFNRNAVTHKKPAMLKVKEKIMYASVAVRGDYSCLVVFDYQGGGSVYSLPDLHLISTFSFSPFQHYQQQSQSQHSGSKQIRKVGRNFQLQHQLLRVFDDGRVVAMPLNALTGQPLYTASIFQNQNSSSSSSSTSSHKNSDFDPGADEIDLWQRGIPFPTRPFEIERRRQQQQVQQQQQLLQQQQQEASTASGFIKSLFGWGETNPTTSPDTAARQNTTAASVPEIVVPKDVNFYAIFEQPPAARRPSTHTNNSTNNSSSSSSSNSNSSSMSERDQLFSGGRSTASQGTSSASSSSSSSASKNAAGQAVTAAKVMGDNIDALNRRGEGIQRLDLKVNAMNEEATKFLETIREHNRKEAEKSWWQI
jgi:hypothetical protein